MQVAEQLGAQGSSFVAKLFMGGEFEAVRAELRERYHQVKVIRPKGTRQRSVELFLVGLEKK
jgi:23S rRNA (uridine2552-2'-O)-methyltransferase